MRKTSAAVILGIVLILWATTAVFADAQTEISEVERLYNAAHEWDGGSVVLGPPHLYVTGLEEQKALDLGSRHTQQRRLEGFEDAYFELLLYDDPNSIDSLMKSNYSTKPMGFYILIVHYPENTGNADIDKALKDRAKKIFMRPLPIDPEEIRSTDIPQWAASKPPQDHVIEIWYEDLIENLLINYNYWNNQEYTLKRYREDIRNFYSTTYFIPRNDSKYLIVAFNEWFQLGYRRPWDKLDILNFDKQTGMLISLNDLVPNIENSLPLIVNRLKELSIAKFAEKEQWLASQIESRFDINSDYCYFDPEKINNWFQAALMPEGLVFAIPYSVIHGQWESQEFVTIPKEELAGLGIETRFW